MTTSDSIAGHDLEVLREAVTGEVFAPGDAGYDQARQADSYRRLQKIKASYDPDQAIISAHPVWPSRADTR